MVAEATGDRAFCAGGDIRTLRDWVLAGECAPVEAFFAREYALNRAIARFPKPYVALIDGVCMGGGIGLSVHGAVRVVTEHASLAMPETQIGFFPDVGASFVLPRLRGDYGLYLGLTGARVSGPDAVWLGLATHFVPRARARGLADAMAEDGIAPLAGAAEPPPLVELATIRQSVALFAAPSLETIFASLDRAGTDWARDTLSTLRAASPFALRETFELVRAGAGRTLEQCQDAELALALRMVRHPDFAEGVRAMVVDKDRNPRWSHEYTRL